MSLALSARVEGKEVRTRRGHIAEAIFWISLSAVVGGNSQHSPENCRKTNHFECRLGRA